MKKRMIAVALVVAMMMTVAANALSIDADTTVTAIPEIYVTFIPAEGMEEFENSSFNYVKAYEAELNGEEPMTVNGVQPTVIKLDAATVVRSEDPIMSQVRDRYAALVASGNNITSANIVLPDTGRLLGRNGASICSDGDDDGTDEGGSYWELNSTYWGVYNGYDFRYYWSTFAYESSEVDVVDGIPQSTVGWEDVLRVTIRETLNFVMSNLAGDVAGSISNIIGTFSSWFSAGSELQGVSHSFDANAEYARMYNEGSYHYKHILIEDVNNREPDDIYCAWGHVTRMDYQTYFRVRYKTSNFLDGAPIYASEESASSIRQLHSDTYQNETMIFQKAIETYNYVGVNPFFEDIDVRATTFTFE